MMRQAHRLRALSKQRQAQRAPQTRKARLNIHTNNITITVTNSLRQIRVTTPAIVHSRFPGRYHQSLIRARQLGK
jgi:hypothetical protein